MLQKIPIDPEHPTVSQAIKSYFLFADFVNLNLKFLEKLGRHAQIPQLAYFEEDEEFYLVEEFIKGHCLKWAGYKTFSRFCCKFT